MVKIKAQRKDDDAYFAWVPGSQDRPVNDAQLPIFPDTIVSVPQKSVGVVLFSRMVLTHWLVYTLMGSRVIVFNVNELVPA